MTNWKDTVLEQLTTKPEDWRLLGELFNRVADDIPMHTAIRGVAVKKRHELRSRGLDDTVASADFDLAKAQWLLFTQFVLPLVERKDNIHRATQTEQVRLKPHNNCKTCGSPTYIAKLGVPGAPRAYKCLNCAKPKLVSTNPVVELPQIKTPPPLRLVPASPPAVQQLPKPIRPPKPKPEPVPIAQDTIYKLPNLTSLTEVWRLFTVVVPIPSFQSNPKLRKMLYRAFEAGVFDEYKRVTLWRASEFSELQLHKNESGEVRSVPAPEIWGARASTWLAQTFTSSARSRWNEVLVEAFSFGAYYILTLTINNNLGVIHNEMERLRMQLEPPPKQPKQPKQRWGTPIKAARNMVSRWFMK